MLGLHDLFYSSCLNSYFKLERGDGFALLRLISEDGTNRLSRECVLALTGILVELAGGARPVIVAGNEKFFSVGADLREIGALGGAEAYEFAGMGQALMNAIARFPAPVYAAIEGHCMGGGLDLALACSCRIAAPGAVFGHRGAALGLMTGWGGTQRLSPVGREGEGVGIVCCGGEGYGGGSVADWVGGCRRGRSGGRGYSAYSERRFTTETLRHGEGLGTVVKRNRSRCSWVGILASHPLSQRTRKKDGAPLVLIMSAKTKSNFDSSFKATATTKTTPAYKSVRSTRANSRTRLRAPSSLPS